MQKNIVIITLMLAISSCANFDLEKRKIQQGNIINEQQLAKVNIGYSRSEVAEIMGNPVLVDVLESDRWNYVYNIYHGNRLIEQKTVVIYFEDDKVSSIPIAF